MKFSFIVKSMNSVLGVSSLIAILFIILVVNCTPLVIHNNWKSEEVRIPFTKEIVIMETNQEYILIRVEKGDCLSKVIEKGISKYIKMKGYSGTYYFIETIYSIIETISFSSLKSRNKNLVYPGETIKFRLPKRMVLSRTPNYYSNVKRCYGLKRLIVAINFKWLADYKANYFDCSERSAFLEYLLENEGFNTLIVEDKSHCWIVVEVEKGKFVHVEAVSSPPHIMEAREYFYCYKTVYDAIQTSSTEYDWWNISKQHKHLIARRISYD
jgi:hypothetical protein